MIWWLAPLLMAVLVVGTLTISKVRGWFNRHRILASDYGELIKVRLAEGNYRVVAGIFDQHGQRIASQEWAVDKISHDLEEWDGDGWIRVVL